MIVNTAYGKLEGIEENGCHIFKGVPYAKPPIGELRFCKPQRMEAWNGIYGADHFRNKSMQGPARPGFYKKEFYSNPAFDTVPSEDCLYLNIWVPEHHNGDKLPTAVYVHGGAFLGGAGSNLPFVCTKLAKAGVIVVTINYRLGVFGFLCHPLLGVEGENEAGGNYGLWDQLAAFQWIKENIQNFGGDADNITVFGQSAGAMSLQTLAVSSKARGVFQRMILQSGGGYRNPLAVYRTIENASETAEDLLEALGMKRKQWMESQEKREKARKILYETPGNVMMEAMGAVIAKAFEQKKGIPFTPVVDGELLVKDGNLLIDEGKYLPVSYLIGANEDDLTTEETPEMERSPENNLMHRGNIAFAEKIKEDTGIPAYVYYFKRKLPGDDSGAFHSAELWYVFGSLEYCWRPMEKEDYELSDRMIGCWTNFMKTGDPGKSGGAADEERAGKQKWRPCTKEDPYYEIFDVRESTKCFDGKTETCYD